jgi:two-component system LytT family response regulator
MSTIYIPTNKGVNIIDLENILRIQSISNYCRIYFTDKTYPLTVAKLLQWFEDNLPAETFVRTHRTHLVNRNHIRDVSLSSHLLHLSNGDNISISRRRKQMVKERLCA